VFLVAVALVFGIYYLWMGVRDFLYTGGLGIAEATERAVIISTATAEQVQQFQFSQATPRPTSTPIPPCQDFIVSVPSAIVRERASTNAPIITSLPQGTSVCVIGREGDSEWYLIDSNSQTRRLEAAYMHQTVIEAVNPTLTPSQTFTPLPTVTPAPTLSATPSPTITPNPTRDPRVTETPSPTSTATPTLTPSATTPLQSA
jgi:hypothetical protein